MRILILHNYYQHAGGEDVVLQAERSLLEANGHEVALFIVNNDDIKGFRGKVKTALNIAYSKTSKKKVLVEISKFQPDLVHVHNFFPLLTPSIYDACHEAGVPIVQTLHNYRTICPGALLMRDERLCEECIIGSAYKAVLYGCYRGSRLGTLSVARMVEFHRKNRTWSEKVNRFIALTSFAKSKFVEAGFPESKMVVKANFFSREEFNAESEERKGALFIGRLSIEKGVHTMLSAWRNLEVPLKVVGTGPLFDEIRTANFSTIRALGFKKKKEVLREMSRANFLVMPSLCYEGFPMVLVEAFAHGLPVIASKLGSMAEIVEAGITGLHFEAGNAEDLAEKVRWSVEHPEEMRRMGENARKVYEEKYTPDINYRQLIKIYETVIAT